MKRFMSFILAVFAILGLPSCRYETWDGFYEEDLTRYVTLGSYQSLTYTAYDTSVAETEIDAAIATRLEAQTPLTETERAVAEGLTVAFDRYCFIRGVAVPMLSEENVVAEVGASYEDTVLAELLIKMLGMKQGNTAEYTVTLPVGYAEDMAATEAVYRITVLAVYEKNIPELTDAVAATLMTGCRTVAELRERIAVMLEKEKREEAAYRVEAELWNQVVSASELLRIPTEPYRDAYTVLYSSYEALAKADSVSLEDYAYNALGMTLAELKTEIDDRVRVLLKEKLVLYSLVKTEGIVCTEAEQKAYAERMAQASDGLFGSGDDYMAYFGEETVTEQYLREAVTERLLAYATATKPS